MTPYIYFALGFIAGAAAVLAWGWLCMASGVDRAESCQEHPAGGIRSNLDVEG